MNRQVMIARSHGQYAAGALTWAGDCPQVMFPHAQLREIIWWTPMRSVIGVMSNTCARWVLTTGAGLGFPQHRPGQLRSCAGPAPSQRAPADVTPGEY